jgi:hypothetical protein
MRRPCVAADARQEHVPTAKHDVARQIGTAHDTEAKTTGVTGSMSNDPTLNNSGG